MIETNPDSHRMERGIVYIATGEACRQEAIRSAKSVKMHNPSLGIAIFSEMQAVDPVFDFHYLIEHPEFSPLDKVKNLWKTPFHKTVFLDSDTYVLSDLTHIFDILGRIDFAGTHEVARGYWYNELQNEVPDAFCELNGGMLVFKALPEVISLLKNWHDAYLKTTKWLSNHGSTKWILTNDQASLRYLLWQHQGLKLWVMPTEYNALRNNGTYLWGSAKIVHGRGNIEAVAERMNRFTNVERAFFQGFGVLADFGRVSLRHIFETCFRINYLAAREVCRRVFRKFR
jgi:hypothetical protein